jgi:PAS domain S-box-containing protein
VKPPGTFPRRKGRDACAPNLHAHVAAAIPNLRHPEHFHDHHRIEHVLFDGALSPADGDLGRPGALERARKRALIRQKSRTPGRRAMTVNFEDDTGQRRNGRDGGSPPEAVMSGVVQDRGLGALDLVLGLGEPQRVGRFRFFLDGQRWEWSEAVARMHGYEPGQVEPTTELLLQHKHPEDRERVAAVLDRVVNGKPFSSRHRIIDTAGRIRCVVVAGDSVLDDTGALVGTSGFYIDVTDSLHSDITNALEAVADSRARIEQAKGVLMSAYGISADRAFDILAWRSQETNLKVRDLAARFLEAVAGKASPDTRTHIDHALLTLE